jgi:hypothetical protein
VSLLPRAIGKKTSGILASIIQKHASPDGEGRSGLNNRKNRFEANEVQCSW